MVFANEKGDDPRFKMEHLYYGMSYQDDEIEAVLTRNLPGIKPGAKTAEYIEQVVERITLPGALFLTIIALMPTVIGLIINVPFAFGGTSLLIVVGVALDTMAQMQQHLLLRKYDGFMKKGRVRFRGRQATGQGF